MPKKLTDFDRRDRPREKMMKKGAEVLAEYELLAVLLGSGVRGHDVFAVSRKITQMAKENFENVNLENLQKIPGIGAAKAAQIVAAIEFSRRFLLPKNIKIRNAKNIFEETREIREKRQEYFLVLTLDGAGDLIAKRTVFIGTVDRSMVHPREVFADAIADRAAAVVFVHNHPSGSVEASEIDISVTRKLVESAKILGINVFDHVIVAKGGFFSFRESGLI